MTDLTTMTLAEAREALQNRKISAVELAESYFEAIDQGNESLNAYV